MKRSDIVKFISAKNCCYSSEGLDLFNKVRGGNSTSSCCITKHNLAHTAMDMMQCANVQDTWYKVVMEFTVDNTAGDSSATFTRLKISGVEDNIYYQAGNGANANSLSIVGGVSDHTTAIIIAQEITSTTPSLLTVGLTPHTSLSSTDFEVSVEAVDTARIRITIWGNENLFVEDTTTYPTITWTDSDITITEDTSKRSKAVTTERKYSCLTSAQICDLADYINRYCDSCTDATPAAVTT